MNVLISFCRVKHVYGFELVPEAVTDARRNAERNGINNATFTQGDLNKLTEDFGKDFSKPDIVIIGALPHSMINFAVPLLPPLPPHTNCPSRLAPFSELVVYSCNMEKLPYLLPR